MKRNLFITAVVLALVTGCTDAQNPQATSDSYGPPDGAMPVLERLDQYQPVILTDVVRDGLVYMREEEKVARDVYRALSQKYSARVFVNIPKSEQKHMDAVKRLLDRYGIEDPVGENGEGVFRNAELQKLYTDLVARGSVSLQEAYAVGRLIEETDIADLDKHLAEVDSNSDIAAVYAQLRVGSTNHLRAFSR